ncbi:MAG TPA: cysteine hydrolase family protein [Pirellulales bacterium]|nr:cysteine hydrolase family protein [Pirellulales bacterium]
MKAYLRICFPVFLIFALRAAALGDELKMNVRKAVPVADDQTSPPKRVDVQVAWDPAETAIIIVDMWDDHHCKSAAARVAEMAPAMNRAVKAARAKGVFVIHAPSDCMDFYEGTPQRQRAIDAPLAKARVAFKWNNFDPNHEGPLDPEVAENGCSCDTKEPCNPSFKAWKREIAAIEIAPADAVSDKGPEIYNLLRQHQIEHVIVMGVHTNICVLGRPFGIRQLVYQGEDVVLCRDLTDSYHRRQKGSHFDGLEAIIRHIERYWCPTITSESLTGDSPFQFAAAK